MRAARRFIAHLGGQHRTFERGEAIPDEWVPGIRNPRVVDEPLPHLAAEAAARGVPAPGPDPYIGLADTKTVDDVLVWVNDPEDPTTRAERAAHALQVERKFRGRVTLMGALQEIVDTFAGQPKAEG